MTNLSNMSTIPFIIVVISLKAADGVKSGFLPISLSFLYSTNILLLALLNLNKYEYTLVNLIEHYE